MDDTVIDLGHHQSAIGKRYTVALKSMMRALLVRHPWIDKILAGTKTLEIRGSKTTLRGKIGLIPSGSGTVTGVCDLVDCIGPLTEEAYLKSARRAGMSPSQAAEGYGYYQNTYAWVVQNPKLLRKPVRYMHPQGAIIWVTLNGRVEQAILKQLRRP